MKRVEEPDTLRENFFTFSYTLLQSIESCPSPERWRSRIYVLSGTPTHLLQHHRYAHRCIPRKVERRRGSAIKRQEQVAGMGAADERILAFSLLLHSREGRTVDVFLGDVLFCRQDSIFDSLHVCRIAKPREVLNNRKEGEGEGVSFQQSVSMEIQIKDTVAIPVFVEGCLVSPGRRSVALKMRPTRGPKVCGSVI